MDGSGSYPTERRPNWEMGDSQLSPEWLQKSSALVDGGLGSAGWRAGNTGAPVPAKTIPSRFDTTSGPARWKEDAASRWSDGGGQGAPPEDRWGDGGAGRGRGRGAPLTSEGSASWKPREVAGEWRGTGADPAPRNDWRNDRWGAAPGSRSNDSWRGSGAPPGGAGRGMMAPPGTGGAAGFAMGRGAGGSFARADSFNRAPSGDFGARGRAPSSSFFRSFGPGGGVGGSLAWGPSKAQRRYTTDQLAFVYRQLLYSGRLKLPRSVERDDPLLFLADGDFVDVVEQFSGVDPNVAAEVYVEHQALLARVHSRGHFGGPAPVDAGPAAAPPQQADAAAAQQQPQSSFFAQLQVPQAAMQQQQQHPQQGMAPPMAPLQAPDPGWVYQDPQGLIQGPFPRQDIIDWFEGGFFPLSLQLRSVLDPPNAPFHPLGELLQIWRGAAPPPPGYMPPQPAFQPQQQQPMPPMQQQHYQQQQQQQGYGAMPANAFAPQQQPQGLPEDLLAGSLQGLNVGGGLGSAPAQAPAMAFDPVVDPSVVKRAPSQGLLSQPSGPEQLPLGSALLAPAPTPAPWAPEPAVPSPAPAPETQPVLSLADIQAEEQRRRAQEEEEEAQRQAAEAAAAADAAAAEAAARAAAAAEAAAEAARNRPETKPAPWVAAAPSPEPAARGKSLLEIQAEEAERRAKLEAQQAAAAAAARAAAPPGGGWARVARGGSGATGPTLLEIQEAEERAKAVAVKAPAAAAPAAAEEDDEGLFWEYEKPAVRAAPVAAPAPPPPAVVRPKTTGWAAAASKGVPAAAVAVRPVNGGAAAARPAVITAPRRPAPAAVPPPPPPPAFASEAEELAAALAASAAAAGGGPASDAPTASALSGPFRAWCVEQMQSLTGSADVTLCEFLMTVESNSEVAEYVSTVLGATPAAARFSAEFLKRKLAEQAASTKKSRKARAKANAAAAALLGSGSAAAGKTAGAAAGGSWAEVSGVSAAGGKKKKKGQKLDPAGMGFTTGTDFSLLESA